MIIPRTRTSFLLVLAFLTQVACWVLVLGLRATMNVTVPQYLFGVRISHQLSMNLCLLVLACIPLSGIVALVCGIVVAIRGLGNRSRR